MDYDKIVESIYDCAANPELWPNALGAIKDAVGGAYAFAGFVDVTEIGVGKAPKITRFNSAWDEAWIEKLIASLPTLANDNPDGSGLVGFELDNSWTQLSRTDEAEFQKSDFYNYWVKPQGLRDTLNTPFLQRAGLVGLLAIPSYASREPYGTKECKLIERLSPHIRRAMVINEIADKGKLALALYRSVLDRLSVPVFIVGLGGKMNFCNTAADALLADGNFLRLNAGIIKAARATIETTALNDAMDRALKGDVAVGISGIGVPLTGKNGERAAAYVLPIAGNDLRGDLGQGSCLLFIARRGEQQPIAIEIMRTMFDLTIAEAQIAILIAQGDSPQSIAEALSISINTVRSHLKAVFAKTRTSSQTALGALVNGFIPAVR